MGTLVTLVRVLMLGPVCVGLSLVSSVLREEADELLPHVTAGARPVRGHPPLHQLLPWFIIGFVILMALRSFGLLPHAALAPIASVVTLLTVVSMAALGLGVDVRTIAQAGGRVAATVVLSLIVLVGISLTLIHVLQIA